MQKLIFQSGKFLIIFLSYHCVSLELHSASFMTSEHKAAIDEAAENKNDKKYLAKKIEELFKFAQNASKKNQQFLDNVKVFYQTLFKEDETQEDLIIFGQLISIAITNLDNIKEGDEFFKQIISAHRQLLKKTNDFDQLNAIKNDIAKKRNLRFKLYSDHFSEARIVRYLTPLILTGSNAVFSTDTCIYALTKGVALLGISDTPDLTNHGGLYATPIQFFLHDLGHVEEIINLNFIDIYELNPATLNNIIDAAKFVYNLINDSRGPFLNADEKKRAFYAAFFLLHEAPVRPTSSTCGYFAPHKSYSDENRIEILKNALFGLFEYGTLGNDLTSKDSYKKTHRTFENRRRFASSIASLMASLFPAEKNNIFKDSKDPQLEYDVLLVRKLLFSFINEFHDKIKTHTDNTIDTMCHAPACQKPGNYKCSICKVAKYCSRECQEKDWSRHKLTCKKPIIPN